MIYADFTYYTDVFLGNKVPADDWNRFSRQASKWLDWYTENRITDVTENIKDACCAVSEEMYFMESSSETGSLSDIQTVASETVGKHSVSYTSSKASEMSINERLLSSVYIYLNDPQLIGRAAKYRTGSIKCGNL